jgi:hypothetical protein
MRKLGLGLIGIVVLAAIYYFTSGSTRVIEEMKKQVNRELTTLQQNGFGIAKREVKNSEEHFVLDFSEPEKIVSYLKHQGLQVNIKDLSSLKGMKFAVDAKYLNDTYSALSVDIYPKALPSKVITKLQKENATLLKHIEKRIANKALLIHVDFNKLLNGFKGYIKDIDETFKDEVMMNLLAKGMTFEGSIANEKLKEMQQHITKLSLHADKAVEVSLTDLTVIHTLTGTTDYDTQTTYKLEKLKAYVADNFQIECTNLDGSSTTALHNKLLQSSAHSTIENILLKEKEKRYAFTETSLDVTLNNLDIEAFEKLQKIDSEDHLAINKLSEQILTQGLELNISNLSSKEVNIENQVMGNFYLNAYGKIDPSLDLTTAQQNPLILLQALSSTLHIKASPTLFTHLMQDPRAMMVMMLIPPQEKHGEKIYDVSYIKGKLTVNGISF